MKILLKYFFGLFPIIYVIESWIWSLYTQLSAVDVLSVYLLSVTTIAPGVFLLVLPFYYGYRSTENLGLLIIPPVIISIFIKFPMIFYWIISSGRDSSLSSMMFGFHSENLLHSLAMLLCLITLYLNETGNSNSSKANS